MELIIVRGLPGSGKSTYCKEHYPNHLIYEPDHLFCDIQGTYRYEHQIWTQALTWVYMMTDFALSRGENVVITDVFPNEQDIAPYKQLAKYHGADFKIITRTKNYGSIHHVPKTIFDEMSDQFEKVLDNSLVM